ILEPADFEFLAIERASLNRTAVVVRHELVLLVEATDSTFVWKCIGAWLVAGGDEIGRATVEWDTEHGARKARALNDRFKITGQNTLGLAQACHAHGLKILFEEGASGRGILRPQANCFAANVR